MLRRNVAKSNNIQDTPYDMQHTRYNMPIVQYIYTRRLVQDTIQKDHKHKIQIVGTQDARHNKSLDLMYGVLQ